jgi:hypothetical protein
VVNDNGVPAWLVGIGTLGAAVVAFFALTAGDDDGTPAVPSATVTATTTATVTKTVGGGTQGGTGDSWPGEPDGIRKSSGSPAELTAFGPPFHFLDLETNKLTDYTAEPKPEQDLAPKSDGVGAMNGAGFAPWPGKGAPTLKDCRGLPERTFGSLIDLPAVQRRATYCLTSNEGRYGYIRLGASQINSDGELRYVSFSYVLWKKAGDT